MTALVVCVLLMVASAAFAANAGGGPYGPSLPAPCFDTTCSAPCHLTVLDIDCESRDPNVTIDYVGEEGCAYSGTIDWGDGVTQNATFGSEDASADQSPSSITLTHTYPSTADYAATLSGTTDCAFDTGDETGTFNETFNIGILAGHYDLVAIGDSYSSGEGAGHYEASHANCHRSSSAWPRLLPQHTHKVTSVLLLACSGATSAALNGHVDGQPDQLNIIRGLDPSLITLTIGGNDVGFATVLHQCFLGDCISDGTISTLDREIHKKLNQLTDDYLAVVKAAPHARLLVVGYPQLFPDPKDFQDNVFTSQCGYLEPTHPLLFNLRFRLKQADDLLALIGADAELNATIAAAVSIADDRLARHGVFDRVEYVSDFRALNGHEFCTAMSDLVNLGLIRGAMHDQQLGHPTEQGQTEIAKQVAAYINRQL